MIWKGEISVIDMKEPKVWKHVALLHEGFTSPCEDILFLKMGITALNYKVILNKYREINSFWENFTQIFKNSLWDLLAELITHLMMDNLKKSAKKSNCSLLHIVAVWNKLNWILLVLFLISFTGYSHMGKNWAKFLWDLFIMFAWVWSSIITESLLYF